MTFDSIAYWQTHRPPVYPEHAEQEVALSTLLEDMPFRSVLEVGCGEGRITALLPEPVTVLDIEPDRVETTAERTGATGIVSSLQDFTTEARWDLVIAVEVLMHIPPSDIGQACDKLCALSNRWVVTCDWTQPLRKPTAEHNWRHSYRELFGTVEQEIPVGHQTIFVVAK